MTDDKFGVTDNGSAKSFKFNPFGDEDHDEQQSGFSAEERDLALLGAVGSSKTDDIDAGWTSIAEPNVLSESPASLNMTGGNSKSSHSKGTVAQALHRSASGSTTSSGFSMLGIMKSLPFPLPLPSPSSAPAANTSFSNAFPSPTNSGNFPNHAAQAQETSHIPGHKVSSSQSSLKSTSTRASSLSSNHNQAAPSKQPSTLSLRTVMDGSQPQTLNSQPGPSTSVVTPVAGFRIPATASARLATFPVLEMCGPAFADKEGRPIYVCSAILGNAVHPGKAGPHLIPPVRISGGGKELGHDGRYDLLPITPEMKWIPASHGLIPEGYTAIQGGYEASGEQLFHAVAKIEGYWVPGKTARHLAGANFPFHHSERYLADGYRILCWRNKSTEANQQSVHIWSP